MCGIAAYAGSKQAAPYLLTAIKRLEYRGYDSFGIAVRDDEGSWNVHKGLGHIDDRVTSDLFVGQVGIAHTRWATHGKASTTNAHPIAGGRDYVECMVVHNGIIENADVLRKELAQKGYVFVTETDTEVIAHLYASMCRADPFSTPPEIVRSLMKKLEGTYAFAMMATSPKYHDCVVLACHGSPLLVSNDGYVASDARALSGFCGDAYRMQDDDIVVVSPFGYTLHPSGCRWEHKNMEAIPALAEKCSSRFPHVMLAEIHEQPTVLKMMRQLQKLPTELKSPPARTVLLGCGSSWHAALLGRMYFEALAEVPSEVDYASEFCFRPALKADALYIALTQSGETADTIAALHHCGPHRLTITNGRQSRAVSLSNYVIDLGCGFEEGVAATKTFTAQAASLLRLAASWKSTTTLVDNLLVDAVPNAIKSILDNDEGIREVANSIYGYRHVLCLARQFNFPVALEGALKLKEVAYMHAEALPAAEMKHGPIALIDYDTLSIFVVTCENKSLPKIISNMQEIRSRGGDILTICDESSLHSVKDLSRWVITVPTLTNVWVQPLLTTVVFQLLAYHIAVKKLLPVDKPRNLAKSVTVE